MKNILHSILNQNADFSPILREIFQNYNVPRPLVCKIMSFIACNFVLKRRFFATFAQNFHNYNVGQWSLCWN
jgi:hypothetical protein